MFKNSITGLDGRKWFDRMLPQTLAIATWLLYIDGAFAILNLIDKRNELGVLRYSGGLYSLFALVACLSYIAGGFLMANGKRLGWYVSIFAAVSPVLCRFLAASQLSGIGYEMTLRSQLMGADTIGFLFEAALFVLLVHPMSRSHALRWFR